MKAPTWPGLGWAIAAACTIEAWNVSFRAEASAWPWARSLADSTASCCLRNSAYAGSIFLRRRRSSLMPLFRWRLGGEDEEELEEERDLRDRPERRLWWRDCINSRR